MTGRALYAGDIRFPGMLYARVLRPPAHGATLTSVDTAPAKEVQGVVIVQQSGLVAVLHELPDAAEDALGKIKAQFAPSPSTLDERSIYAHLDQVKLEANVVRQGGDLAEGRALAVKSLDQTYLGAYVAHSAMETHAALAHVEGDRATVWASTQNPFGAREEIAQAIGLPIESVRVITPFVGGGFGGKSFNLQAVEAALLSKATGRPVQVMWTREEEFFNDTFRPASIVKIQSGLDGAGRIVFWDYEVRFAGDRASEHLYDIPNHRTLAVGGFQDRPESTPSPSGPGAHPGQATTPLPASPTWTSSRHSQESTLSSSVCASRRIPASPAC